MIISADEIAERAESILDCAFRTAITKLILITRGMRYRAIARPKGFSTNYWDFRRARDHITIVPTYAIDLVIVGKSVGFEKTQIFDVSRELGLPGKYLSQSIDCGFDGYDFCDCQINSSYDSEDMVILSKRLFSVGRRLRDKYRRYIG